MRVWYRRGTNATTEVTALRAGARGGPCRSRSWAARPRSPRGAGTCRGRSALTWSCSSRARSSDGGEAVAQHDDRADDRAALVVGRGHDRGLGDGRVRDERRLDLERADPVARGDDHVVGAALEVEAAVLVACDAVAGVPRASRATRLARRGSRRKNVGSVARVEDELAVVDRQAIPGSGGPSSPAATGSPGGMPVSWPVSVWP